MKNTLLSRCYRSGLQVLAILFCYCAASANLSAADAAAGMVLDMQGQAQAELAGKTTKLGLLSYLVPETKVILAEQSKISITL